jgi:hypothetical protein
MTDQYRKLHGYAYSEWKEEQADEYAKHQRKAFMAGFEAAANEGKEFRLLREWCEKERDLAQKRYEENENHDDFVRRMAFVDVLVKLSEIGCRKEKS